MNQNCVYVYMYIKGVPSRSLHELLNMKSWLCMLIGVGLSCVLIVVLVRSQLMFFLVCYICFPGKKILEVPEASFS